MLGWENMLRSTEAVHYRMIFLLEKCSCKGNACKRPGFNARLLHGCPLPGLCLPPPSLQSPCTHVASWIFLRIIFYLPVHQLLQSPPRARLPHQLLLLTGTRAVGDFPIYIQSLSLWKHLSHLSLKCHLMSTSTAVTLGNLSLSVLNC